MITWVFYDRFMNRKMSALSACIGAIVGLVAITPAAGFVSLGHSMLIGFIAALVSNWAIRYQKKLAVDDTLDVFASHGIGGVVGMVLTGVLAEDVGLIHGNPDVFLMHMCDLAWRGSIRLWRELWLVCIGQCHDSHAGEFGPRAAWLGFLSTRRKTELSRPCCRLIKSSQSSENVERCLKCANFAVSNAARSALLTRTPPL